MRVQRASSIRRAVLFRFHRDWITCANHVGIIRALNPGIDVWALYGGEESAEDEAFGELGHLFDHWASIKGRDAQWKYQHSDLAIRSWYQEWGHQLDFDMLHFIEWDLLLLASLEELYGHVGERAIGLTGLTHLCQIQDRWSWCIREPLGEETRRLEEYARTSLGYEGPMSACLAGGCCLPRAFLDRYAKCEITELGHDELRLPLFGALWSFDLVDTGIFRSWFCPDEERLYNANDQEIEDAVIWEQLHLPGGRRAFHPYRRPFHLPPMLVGYRIRRRWRRLLHGRRK